jgi:hypothetical protein
MAVWFALSPATRRLRDALKARLGVGNDALFALAVRESVRVEGLATPPLAAPPPAEPEPRRRRIADPPGPIATRQGS